MSRPQLSASQVDGLSYEKLHETAVELESQNGASQPPTYWFDLALRSAEAARNAERRGSKPGQYVAYTRVAIAYQKCMFHKRLKEARAADHAFSVRVNDFKAVSNPPGANDSSLTIDVRGRDAQGQGPQGGAQGCARQNPPVHVRETLVPKLMLGTRSITSPGAPSRTA